NLGRDGSFRFDDVRPGHYILTTTIGSELHVHVEAQDIEGLELRHVGLTELFVSIRMDDGSAVPDLIGLHVEMDDGKVYSGRLSEDRLWHLPPGNRFVFVMPPDDVYVRSVISAG